MVIIESKYSPGDFVFFVTNIEDVWLVEYVGIDANGQTLYGLKSGKEAAVAYEFELVRSVDDDGNIQHLGNVGADGNEEPA